MNKKLKYTGLLAISVMLLMVLCACGGRKSDDVTTESHSADSNSVDIYRVRNFELVTSGEPYQLKQPDVLTSSVDELIAAMSEDLAEDGLAISWYMLNSENILMINLDVSKEISKENLLLIKASICSTMFQLNKLEGIELSIGKKDEQDFNYESFDRTSFNTLEE